jgi:CRISPR/Cas system CSM-associated protein Csm3 (group 7 of RAMP superfamily)
LDFTIRFHSPFRVATGRAGLGLDATVDLVDPLPASSLKGLMRDSAITVLRAHPTLVSEVFGSPEESSPWTWSSVGPLNSSGGVAKRWQCTSVQARVVVDPETHTVVEDLIMFAETVEHAAARFSLVQTGPIVSKAPATHRALLRASAAAIHHLGGGRTRGLGWVTVSEAGGAITADELNLIKTGDGDA